MDSSRDRTDKPAISQADGQSDPPESLAREFRSDRTGLVTRWIRPFVAGVLLVVLVFTAVYAVFHDRSVLSVGGIESDVLNWLYLFSILYLIVIFAPVVRTRSARTQLYRISRQPILAVSAVYLLILVAAGSLYPFFTSEPSVDAILRTQPPVWGEASVYFIADCQGEIVDGMCQGTFEYPLGTNPKGEDLLSKSLFGLATSLQVAVTATVLAASIGIAVGITAGYTRGRLDEVLMRYIDIQRALPAFLIYILLLLVFSRSYSLLILVFGLLSWGGIARTVRGEVIQRREESYMRAAKLSGARTPTIIRRHILPNVSNTVITAGTVLFAKFVLYEAALGFLTLTDTSVPSLGNEISFATGRISADPSAGGRRVLWDWYRHPHIVAVPGAILCSLLLTVSVLGDGLRDILDPRN